MKSLERIQREVKQIRQAVKAGGYDYSYTYNDKNKTTRRIKCMQNGYNHGAAKYAKMDRAIKKQIEKCGIKIERAGFDLCTTWRGDYYAYVVVIKR